MISKSIMTKTADNKEIYSLLYSNGQKERIVVLVHGACMNYTTGISQFVPQLSTSIHSYDFLSINTRAHDIGYIVNNYREKEGWAWQTLEKNRCDLDAILSHLHKSGYSKIILCGHSWGGLICLDYIQNCNDRIDGLILLSPTISYKLLLEVNFRNDIQNIVDKAKKLVLEKRPDDIVATVPNSPLPFMSAKTIVDFYDSQFDAPSFLEEVKCKTNIIIGSLEHKKLIEVAHNISQKNHHVQTHIIRGANHFYSNHELEVVNVIDSILGDDYYE